MSSLQTYVKDKFNQTIKESSDAELYSALLEMVHDKSRELPTNDDKKRKLYYFSAEFLIGKLLSNNLLNLGIYDDVKAELAKYGKDITDIEQVENEPSLGNGGLGRLAACFLDSISTLGLNGDGVGLNYHFGLFRQLFKDKLQFTDKDEWITGEDDWLIRSQTSYTVPFNNFELSADLYDIDVLGYQQDTRNRLRLFDLSTTNEGIVGDGINFDKKDVIQNLTLFLYPDDSDHDGQMLRIFQQYFMVSAGAQLVLDEAVERGSNLHDLADYAVVQINDTHPALVIPELIRLLTERGIEFDEAVHIVENTVAFTNHTILSEALEKWAMSDLERIVPHITPIIRELDRRMKEKYPQHPYTNIIDLQDRAHMASMSIHYGFSVNGVAALHTDILKSSELRAFYEIYPEKFNNKTNGITFRRWIMDSNPELAMFLDKQIGKSWRTDSDLSKFLKFKDNKKVQKTLQDIKQDNKQRLVDYLEERQGIKVNPNSIFDTQIKRIHEYKRQQMLLLYAIHKYKDIKAGNVPQTPLIIFLGGKAAPAYTTAQNILHAFLTLAEIVDGDKDVNEHLQIVVLENYDVSYAEKLIPATDISEQISLASKEASGTGNMKFMLNGAVTLGTLDGATVEINQLVGDDNSYIFGKHSNDIISLYETNGYNPQDYYQTPEIKELVDFINGEEMVAHGHKDHLDSLHHEIVSKDFFMTMIDIIEYIKVKEDMLEDYEDQSHWTSMVVENIGRAGYFSSDRTIGDYNRDIWHLESK